LIKLNVGAGRNRLPGYIGVDIVEGKGVDKIAPAWKLPFATNEVDEIYTHHVIEHISSPDLDRTLKEFARVLKRGGKLILICPDFEKHLRRWLDGDYTYRWGFGLKMILGYQTHKGQFHTNGFTLKRFRKMLPSYGFEVKVLENRDNKYKRDRAFVPKGDIHVEAIKK